MARRVAAVVEEFDDDTDLPLPSRPLPIDPRGALLEEIGASDDEDISDDLDETVPGPASPSNSQLRPTPSLGPSPKPPSNTITDITPYKKYTHPPLLRSTSLITRADGRAYIQYTLTQSDLMAEVSVGSHARRASGGPSAKTLPMLPTAWVLARSTKSTSPTPATGRTLVACVCSGKRTGDSSTALSKPVRSHLLVPLTFSTSRRTERLLLEMISFQIQRLKPDNIPRPPYTMQSLPVTPAVPPTKASTSSKGKQPAKPKGGGNIPSLLPQKASRLPAPPQPEPPLASRVSPYSPALATGVLVETVKAGMNAPDQGPVGPGLGGAQKGKRKVVRVRG